MNDKTFKTVIISILSLVALCMFVVVIAIAWSVLLPGPTAPTVDARATAIENAWISVTQTQAAIPQTAIPAPANTPAPSSNYLDLAQVALLDFADAMDNNSSWWGVYEDSSAWRVQALAYLDELEIAADGIQALPTPPASLAETDRYLHLSAEETYLMIDDARSGIISNDTSLILLSIDHLETSTKYMNLANDAIPQ